MLLLSGVGRHTSSGGVSRRCLMKLNRMRRAHSKPDGRILVDPCLSSTEIAARSAPLTKLARVASRHTRVIGKFGSYKSTGKRHFLSVEVGGIEDRLFAVRGVGPDEVKIGGV
jgi:hypothetical protein